MSDLFSPEVLRDIRLNISRALTDTFQMMFRMDVSIIGPEQVHAGENIHAYITMANRDAHACLSVSVSRAVVEYICDGIKPGESPHPAAFIQDVVCEITNIVSNHLRSYMADTMGVEFKLSLPKAGRPPPDKAGMQAINLHFRMEKEDCIALGFSYAA